MFSDVHDLLHATTINLDTIKVQTASLPDQTILPDIDYFKGLIRDAQEVLKERPEQHLDYLITKQIQEEEENVRRERLTDYEEKIYDQRRIVADKEAFFENLLRPKKKRASHQTMEEFQEARAREKEQEERTKIEMMNREYIELHELRKVMGRKGTQGQEKKPFMDSTVVSAPDVPS